MTTNATESIDKKLTQNPKTDNLEAPLSKLEFVRLKIPSLIPRDLIDSVKGRTFSPEQFIKYQEQQVDNPGNFLYVLIDKDKKIHGYLWAELNTLDRTLFVNTFSISKSYWGKGQGIKKAIEFLDGLKKKTEAPRVYWVTTNERFFAKHKFKRSKNCLMEYNSN